MCDSVATACVYVRYLPRGVKGKSVQCSIASSKNMVCFSDGNICLKDPGCHRLGPGLWSQIS